MTRARSYLRATFAALFVPLILGVAFLSLLFEYLGAGLTRLAKRIDGPNGMLTRAVYRRLDAWEREIADAVGGTSPRRPLKHPSPSAREIADGLRRPSGPDIRHPGSSASI